MEEPAFFSKATPAEQAMISYCRGWLDGNHAARVAAGREIVRPFLKGAHHYARARVLAALGDREGSMRALETAFSQGLPWDGAEMHLNIAFRALRDSPPFIELMKPKG